jgi:glycosyltransferase involved in cell wall biosynthesis
MSNQARVAVAWQGLPSYAARLLRRVLEERDISILGTPGPQKRAEILGILGREIIWLGGSRNPTWQSLGLPVPQCFFVSGWSNPQFNLLSREAREAGACIVLMADNRRKHNLRQAAGSIIFRMKWRSLFDYAFVPGAAATDLMRFYGVPERRIRSGLYGADPQVFSPLLARERDFLFVGQFTARKGLCELMESVADLRRVGARFTLAALGAGQLEGALRTAGITVLPFGDASYVAQEMRRSRFLVLPSLEDHWGVVVHEAACSGCGLILSDGVGAARDLLTADNGLLCRQGQSKSLSHAMTTALQIPPDQLARYGNASLHIASCFGPERFAEAVGDILSRGGSGAPAQAGMTRNVRSVP